MICFMPAFVRSSSDPDVPATLSDVADHIVHAGQQIGYEHVGIGSDFDGMFEGPEGLDDVADYPALVAELLKRGFGEEELEMLCGGNLIRVLRDVERFAEEGGGREMEMMCDEVGELLTEELRTTVEKKGQERLARRVKGT